jgi:hypothetical protein
MSRQCEKCGGMLSRDQKRFCSKTCAGIVFKQVEKICQACGKKYLITNTRAAQSNYCSIGCVGIGKRKRASVCKRCGQFLKPGEGWKRDQITGKIIGANRRMTCDKCFCAKKLENKKEKRKLKIIDGFLEWLGNTGGVCKACASDLRRRRATCSAACYHKTLMTNPKKHISQLFRKSLGKSLKGAKGERKTFSILGYSVDEIKHHLEKQFQPGMTWNNYGKGWHVDHIIPLRAFNFSDTGDPDFARAWAMSTLRPLWAEENRAKNGKLYKPFQPCLQMGAGA